MTKDEIIRAIEALTQVITANIDACNSNDGVGKASNEKLLKLIGML